MEGLYCVIVLSLFVFICLSFAEEMASLLAENLVVGHVMKFSLALQDTVRTSTAGEEMYILTSIENSSDLPLYIHMMSTSGVEFDIDPSMLIFSCNPDLRISTYAPL